MSSVTTNSNKLVIIPKEVDKQRNYGIILV